MNILIQVKSSTEKLYRLSLLFYGAVTGVWVWVKKNFKKICKFPIKLNGSVFNGQKIP